MNPTLRKNHDEALALAKYRKGNFLILVALAAVMALSTKSLKAADVYWDGGTTGTGTTMQTGGNYNASGANTAPSASDRLIFGGSYLTAPASSLPSNLTWQVPSAGGTYNVGSFVFINNFNAANTVTIGNAGNSNSGKFRIAADPNGYLIDNQGTTGVVTFQNVGSGGTAGVTLDLQLHNSGAINVATGGTVAISSAVVNSTGTGASSAPVLTKSGGGTLILDSANTYTGGTILNAGVLQAGSATALGTGALTINGGTLAAKGSPRTLANNITVGGDFTLGGAAQSLTLSGTVGLGGANRTVTLANDATLGGVISNGGLIINGSDKILTFNGNNTYSSGTIINSGTVLAGNNTALGTGTITINGGALSSTVSQRTLANNIVAGGNFTLGGGGQGTIFNGNLDLGGSTRTITLANSATFGGVISNGGVDIDASSSARNFTVQNAATYTGGTTVRGGNLKLSGSGALAATGAVDIAASTTTATLDISGLTAAGTTIGSLAGGSAASVALGGKSLTVGGNNSSTTYAGSISGTGGSLVKTGNGSMELTKTNTYTGATTVDGGTLRVVSGGSIASSAATVNTGGTLDVDGTAGSVTVNSGGTVEGVGTVSALTVASGGTFAPGNSPGTLNVSGNAVWNGGGHYEWEINNWTGSQGTNWDFLNITGSLTINAAASDFIIDVISLLATNGSGEVPNFSESNIYTFAIATAAGGISGFNVDDFTLNTSGFAGLNGSFGGTWAIAQDTNTINLVYTGANYTPPSGATAIPEPSTGGLLFVGLGLVAACRRNKKS